MDAHMDTHTHTDNVKTVYPPQTKFAGGIIIWDFYTFVIVLITLQF